MGRRQQTAAPAHHFNLSHSDDTAVLAISNEGEVGVDVELLHVVQEASALADLHFTPAEREDLAHTPIQQREWAFLSCWTRKEACLKAIGVGLNLPLRSFGVGILLSGERRVVLQSAACTLRLASFELGGGVIGAVARLV